MRRYGLDRLETDILHSDSAASFPPFGATFAISPHLSWSVKHLINLGVLSLPTLLPELHTSSVIPELRAKRKTRYRSIVFLHHNLILQGPSGSTSNIRHTTSISPLSGQIRLLGRWWLIDLKCRVGINRQSIAGPAFFCGSASTVHPTFGLFGQGAAVADEIVTETLDTLLCLLANSHN